MEIKTNKKRYERPQKYRELPKGGLHVVGIDFGYRGIHCVKKMGKHEIWKAPGHSGWSGIGMTSYYPTTYYLVEIVVAPVDYGLGVVLFLNDGEFGLHWRAGIKTLQDIANRIEI